MILIEDTHWPLVVVGVAPDPGTDRALRRRARAHWRSLQLRVAVLVVPGRGRAALAAHDRLMRWLSRHRFEAALCRTAAWVIPDDGVRTSVAALLEAHGHAFGGPCATFRTVSAALAWIAQTVRGEESATLSPAALLENCEPLR